MMNNIVSVLEALVAYTFSSVGNVIQKKGSPWMGWKGEKGREFWKFLLIWIAGFIIFNLTVIPLGMASKNLAPHIVSSISGWGITVIILCSYFFLKEKLFLSDLFYSLLIILGIFIVNIVQKPTETTQINKTVLLFMIIFPFLLLAPAFMKKTPAKWKALIFAAVSGVAGGISLVVLNVLVKEAGNTVLSYLASPWLYLYGLTGFGTFVIMQFAFKTGEMVLIGPVQTSFNIIYPVFCSYLIFGAPVNLIQIIAVIVIVASNVGILRKR